MAYREREAEAAAQIIEAQQVFAEYQRAEEAVRAFGFDFVWEARTDGEHLHKVAVDGEVLKDFGLRNAKLESIVRRYAEKKAAALKAHDHWAQERQRMQKRNVAHQVGRLLVMPVKVLDVL